MTDKVQKIREEVEKRYEYWKEKESNFHSIESDIRMSECHHLLLMFDSMQKEPVSEDLEEAAEKYAYEICPSIGVANTETELAFKAGAKWQKEQMMAKAIYAVVSQVPCANEIILYNPSSVDYYYLPQEMNKLGLNKGDKIKLVIIKED